MFKSTLKFTNSMNLWFVAEIFLHFKYPSHVSKIVQIEFITPILLSSIFIKSSIS